MGVYRKQKAEKEQPKAKLIGVLILISLDRIGE